MRTAVEDHAKTPPPAAGDASSGAPDADRVRRFHGNVSRTWELELIISGAVLYGLIHLPGMADGWVERTLPFLSREVQVAVLLGGFFAKGTAYVLIGCFVVHLCARAFWVGLIGLDSVFPHGIRWGETRYGPVSTRVFRESASDLPSTVRRLDDLCSTFFSLGFLIAFGFGYGVLFAVVGLLLAGVISRVLFGGEHLIAVFYAIGALFLVPAVAMGQIDKRWGSRLAEGSRGWRALYRGMRWFAVINGFRLIGGVMLTLSTNLRHRLFQIGIQVVSALVILGVMAEFMVQQGELRLNAQEFVPAERGEHTVARRHYETMRNDRLRFDPAPFIQSDMVRDPYVRLFIPYRTERHNAALASRCPGVPPLQEAGLAFGDPAPVAAGDAAAVLTCAAELHAVTLNGAAVDGLELRFFTHPESGLNGFVGYIPTAELPRGRNELRLLPAPPARPSAASAPPEPYVIPFWL